MDCISNEASWNVELLLIRRNLYAPILLRFVQQDRRYNDNMNCNLQNLCTLPLLHGFCIINSCHHSLLWKQGRNYVLHLVASLLGSDRLEALEGFALRIAWRPLLVHCLPLREAVSF
jgi:hypothetical protein